jgi:gamma-glutamylputrescine oxidase
VTKERVIARVVRGFKRRFPHLEHVRFIQYWPGRIDTTRDLLPTMTLDERAPHIGVIMGCPGLPWATFCGDLAARTALGAEGDDRRYYRYFGRSRGFLVPDPLVRLLGKPVAFSMNQGWAKYYQRD